MGRKVKVECCLSFAFEHFETLETEEIELHFEGTYEHWPQTYWDPSDDEVELNLSEKSFLELQRFVEAGYVPENYVSLNATATDVSFYIEEQAIEQVLSDPNSFLVDTGDDYYA